MATSNIDEKDHSSEQKQICSAEDISSKTQQFLNSDELNLITDPKLKREKQKLNELLGSYKKLIDKLDSKFENDDVKADYENKLHKIPEIYAILHPELYKNPREQEKNELIRKFSKRQFRDIDKIAPPLYRTPPANFNDIRQAEKERLIKIISSCPARFHNLSETTVPLNKGRRTQNHCLARDIFLNQREAEKERLRKILANSATYYHKNLDTNRRSFGKKREVGNIPNSVIKYPKELSSQASRRSVSSPYASTGEEIANLRADKAIEMVRVGEYSPLTSKERSRTLFGYGEHEERRTQLLAERRKEYKHYLSNNLRGTPAKVEKALLTENDDLIEETDDQKRSRSHSISTQTEDLPFDVIDGVKETSLQATSSKNANVKHELQISPRQVYYLSPREKLMSDLHGVSRCFPGASPSNDKSFDSQDNKLRQAAYARALQEQIQEKRKIEEERKNKERHEDDLIEQRIRIQQEKVQIDTTTEQKKKQDWIAQRQSQEEIMRSKMVEMKFEAQELRKQQNRKKRESGNVSELRALPVSIPQTSSSEPSHSKEFIKPQTTSSEPSRGRDLQEENIARAARLPEQRFNAVERAPLLEADRQNILSNYVISGQPVFTSPPKATRAAMKPPAQDIESRIREREKADELLRVPFDFRIDRPREPSNRSGSNTNVRSPSPPIPALRTRDIINNNTKVLDDKWKIPGHGRELNRTQANHDNILTQLGAFRRQLQQEHLKLEARLQKEASTT